MNRRARAAVAALTRGPIRFIVAPVITPLDRAVFRLSGGRWKLTAPMIPSLMLFSTGAKSGLRRESPLMCFPREDGSWFIAGSNWGMQKHPAWSGNLIANPHAEIHYHRALIPVTAQLLDATELEATWPILEEQWPHYRDYEKTAHRDIRVFRLVRR